MRMLPEPLIARVKALLAKEQPDISAARKIVEEETFRDENSAVRVSGAFLSAFIGSDVGWQDFAREGKVEAVIERFLSGEFSTTHIGHPPRFKQDHIFLKGEIAFPVTSQVDGGGFSQLTKLALSKNETYAPIASQVSHWVTLFMHMFNEYSHQETGGHNPLAELAQSFERARVAPFRDIEVLEFAGPDHDEYRESVKRIFPKHVLFSNQETLAQTPVGKENPGIFQHHKPEYVLARNVFAHRARVKENAKPIADGLLVVMAESLKPGGHLIINNNCHDGLDIESLAGSGPSYMDIVQSRKKDGGVLQKTSGNLLNRTVIDTPQTRL